MNKLEQMFETMNDTQKEQLSETIDRKIVMKRESMAHIRAKLEKKLPKKRSFAAFLRPAAIAAAACAVIYLTLGFTVPGVADGLYRLAHPDHVTEQYFATTPEDRDPVREIDAAVTETDAKNLGSRVELLGEYTSLTQYDEEYNAMLEGSPTYREKYGFPAYRAEDFAFLKEIEATDTEVYYNGESLYVNCFLACPDTSRFLNGKDDELAINTFWQILIHDGAEMTLPWSTSSGATQVVDEADRKGLWYSTVYDLTALLPDGQYEMTLLYYVYDCSIDDMAAPGNVGRIVHTVSFDSTPGNHYEKRTVETTLSGTAPLTFVSDEQGGKLLRNRTVSFEGTALSLTFRCMPDGIYVTAETEALPEDWTQEERTAFLDPIVHTLDLDILIGGETVSGRLISYGSDGHTGKWEYAFPIVPSDYAADKEIGLIVSVDAIKSFMTEPNGDTTRIRTDSDAIAYPELLFVKEIGKTALKSSAESVVLP
ncbi:MAG: hypothetical protein II117_01055 [Clostridia bacterium]|nr:hypothetical protein [Clostridia bacterium]